MKKKKKRVEATQENMVKSQIETRNNERGRLG